MVACGVSVLRWATGEVGEALPDPVPPVNASVPFLQPVASVSPVPAELPEGVHGASSHVAPDPDRPVLDHRCQGTGVQAQNEAGSPCAAEGRGSGKPLVEDPRRTPDVEGGLDLLQEG